MQYSYHLVIACNSFIVTSQQSRVTLSVFLFMDPIGNKLPSFMGYPKSIQHCMHVQLLVKVSLFSACDIYAMLCIYVHVELT